MSKHLRVVATILSGPFALNAFAQSEQPAPAELISALRHEVLFERTFRGDGDGKMSSCVSPEQDTLRPDHHRNTGWEPRPMPGLHSAIYRNDAPSEARKPVFAQLSFLAKLGFYRETNGYIRTELGRKAIKEFRLTPAGLAAMHPWQRGAPCFLIGVRELSRVVAIQPANTSNALGEPFTVLVRTEVLNVPSWAQSAEAQALFPEIRELTSPRTEAIPAWKHGDHWTTGLRQQAAERFFSINQRALQAQITQWNKEYALPPYPAAKVEELRRGEAVDAAGKSLESAACFPLRLVAGGDARSTRSRSVFAFYDIEPSARLPTGLAHTVGQLSVLSALTRAGAATVGPIEGAVAWGAPSEKGIAFRIDAKAQQFVDADCLPLGPVGVDALTSFRVQPRQVSVLIHARPRNVPRITSDAAHGIPALQTILNEGAVFEAFLHYSGEDGYSEKNASWRVSGIRLIAPNVLFYDFPATLSPLLPRTARGAGEAISADLRSRSPRAAAFSPE